MEMEGPAKIQKSTSGQNTSKYIFSERIESENKTKTQLELKLLLHEC
jgi:hypothetical protein